MKNLLSPKNISSNQLFIYTVWKSIIKRDHAHKFPWNQPFSNFFSKNVDLTEKMLIFRKNGDRVFDDFSTLWSSNPITKRTILRNRKIETALKLSLRKRRAL